MKIVIVGSDKIFSIENFYVKYLRQAGIDTAVFLASNMFYDYYKTSSLNKVKFRLGISNIYNKINQEFRNFVEQERPEIIWVFKGMEIFPESLLWAKEAGILLVNYNPDNPFLFSGKGSGNSNITDSVRFYDLHFTYNLEIKRQLEKLHRSKTYFLPFGFEVNDFTFNQCSSLPEIQAVCFLGNPDAYRAKMLIALAGSGVSISVFGHDWNKFVKKGCITINPPVYGIKQWEVLRMFRVQLNLMRPHNEQSHNMRTFEVPGIGGIMLAPFTPEHELFFKNGQEAFFYNDFSDCVRLIKSILQLSSSETATIRNNARKRSLTSGYSYESRANEVMRELQKI